MVWRNLLAVALFVFACFQMAGHLADAPALRRVGAASAAAPLPLHFSDLGRHEPFAAALTLSGLDRQDRPFEFEITPGLYAHVAGPSRFRAAYSTALLHAPRLPEPLWTAAWCRGLGESNGALRHPLGVPPDARALAIRIHTRTHGRDDSWLLSPSCTR